MLYFLLFVIINFHFRVVFLYQKLPIELVFTQTHIHTVFFLLFFIFFLLLLIFHCLSEFLTEAFILYHLVLCVFIFSFFFFYAALFYQHLLHLSLLLQLLIIFQFLLLFFIKKSFSLYS